MLRHDTWPEITQFAIQHPLELLSFPLRNYSRFGARYFATLLHHKDRGKLTAEALGHIDYTDDFPPVEVNCEIPPGNISASASDTVHRLAQKYIGLGYKVVVYLAPVPACANAAAVTNRAYESLVLAPPSELSPAAFKQDGFYAHIQPGYVRLASRVFSDTIAHAAPVAIAK
jgi:hypothetical protein